jgi:hypothetical protein
MASPNQETAQLSGSLFALVLVEVADQIHLEPLRKLLGAAPARREPTFKHPAPEYVRFERPPVVEDVDPVELLTGEKFQCRVKYYENGVACVELELPFNTNWDGLLKLTSRWVGSAILEKRADEVLRTRLTWARKALVDPYQANLSEEYYIIHVNSAGNPLTAPAMLTAHGREIVQMVRGESAALAEAEYAEALQGGMSYYPNDLLVAGWVAALVYDTTEGAAPTIQLLEYANTQLLEFRHYDDVLTRVLESVYKAIGPKRGFFSRWKLARQARELNALRLDVTELTERADNSIKFLSDMFYARAYRMAAAKVGVPDYRNLVERKLRIAAELYEHMVNEYHQARSFALEMAVVVILVIELVKLFWK